MAAGEDHVCAIVEDSQTTYNTAVFCWGSNKYGQLGIGDNEEVIAKAKYIYDSTIKNASKFKGEDCVVFRNTRTDREYTNLSEIPASLEKEIEVYLKCAQLAVKGIRSPEKIYAGSHHTCVIEYGKARCWGRNDYGQLGLGTANSPSMGRDIEEDEDEYEKVHGCFGDVGAPEELANHRTWDKDWIAASARSVSNHIYYKFLLKGVLDQNNLDKLNGFDGLDKDSDEFKSLTNKLTNPNSGFRKIRVAFPTLPKVDNDYCYDIEGIDEPVCVEELSSRDEADASVRKTENEMIRHDAFMRNKKGEFLFPSQLNVSADSRQPKVIVDAGAKPSIEIDLCEPLESEPCDSSAPGSSCGSLLKQQIFPKDLAGNDTCELIDKTVSDEPKLSFIPHLTRCDVEGDETGKKEDCIVYRPKDSCNVLLRPQSLSSHAERKGSAYSGRISRSEEFPNYPVLIFRPSIK